jgi:predicted CoA-binding protein
MTGKENVAILGASDRSDRFAFRADKLLQSHGHTTVLVNPNLKEIEEKIVLPSLAQIPRSSVDTVTLYVNPKILAGQIKDVIALKPKRVIFNPGTEDVRLEAELKAAGIEPVRGCTLVMLETDTY